MHRSYVRLYFLLIIPDTNQALGCVWNLSLWNDSDFVMDQCLNDLRSGDAYCVNSSPAAQNGHRFADDVFRCIFLNEDICILIEISPKFVPKGPIDDNPAFALWSKLGWNINKNAKVFFQEIRIWTIGLFVQGPSSHRLALIPAWISYRVCSKMWDWIHSKISKAAPLKFGNE